MILMPAWRRASSTALLVVSAAASPLTAQDRHPTGWIAQLHQIVREEMADKTLPAFALVLVDAHRSLVEIAEGHRIPGGTDPVTAETLFRTGSVGKVITDLAVMAAADRGRLSIEADLRGYLPDFHPVNPFDTPITLRQLMTHTAGLVREPPVGSYFDDTSPSLAATVGSLSGTTLLWEPGTRTKYSNAGVAVAGRVLEEVYGRPYADVIATTVFEPAGMTTARVGYRDDMTPRLARGEMWDAVTGNRWTAPVFDLGMSPAGDLYASLRDMAALLRTLLASTDSIVRAETLERMWRPAADPTRSEWHLDVGLGFSLNGKFAGRYRMARHGGAVYGYATELAILPEEGLAVYAVATKEAANGSVRAVAHWALRAALAAREGRPPPEYELTSTPFSNLADRVSTCSTIAHESSNHRFLGRYGWEHNPLTVCEVDGRLHALIEWFFLYPLSEIEDGVFGFPSYALYGHERLWFVGGGEHAAAAVVGYGDAGVRFERLQSP